MNPGINRWRATVGTVIVIVAVGSAVHEARRAARLERTLEGLRRQPPDPKLLAEPPRREPPAVFAVQSNRPSQVMGWQRLESPDYRQYIINLRAVGCPEETIQDIILADVNKLYGSRAKALRVSSTNRYEYWKPHSSSFGSMLSEEMTGKMQELAEERMTVLNQLLGATVPERLEAWPFGLNPFELMLDFLPGEKQAKAMEVEQQLTARSVQTAKAMAKGDYTGRDRAYAEREARLAALLTPEEKFEYDLRMSPGAMILKNRLSNFEPTEQEFRQMARLQQQFFAEFGLPKETRTPDEEARWKAGKEALGAQMKIVLGEQRYGEFEAQASSKW